MKVNTKGWVVSAALCMALAVAARAAEVDTDLPKDTDIVAHVNVRQLLDSPLIKQLALDHMKKALKLTPEVETVLDELGFNPFTDLTSFTVAGSGGDPARNLLVMHGQFKLDKFKTRAEDAVKEGGPLKIVPAGSYMVYEVNLPEAPAPNLQDVFVALPDANTLMASPNKDILVQALDQHTGKQKGEINADLKARFARHGATETAWIVALSRGLAKSPIASDPTAKKEFLDKSITIGASVGVSKDVLLSAVIDANNEKDAGEIAKKLNELVDQGKATLQAFAQGIKELGPLVEVANSLQVSTEGKVVSLKGTISDTAIERAIKR